MKLDERRRENVPAFDLFGSARSQELREGAIGDSDRSAYGETRGGNPESIKRVCSGLLAIGDPYRSSLALSMEVGFRSTAGGRRR